MRFTKMQGLGNDFMVIDAINQAFAFDAKTIALWADRKLGIGFDQCLVIEKTTQPNYDFFYRIFNADGSEVGQCGNGARCVAKFIKDKKLSLKNIITLKTITTEIKARVHDNQQVSIWLEKPELSPINIPLATHQQQDCYFLELNEKKYTFHALSVGNPHAIFFEKELCSETLNLLGDKLNQHSLFPEGVNVSLAVIENNTNLSIQTYERGVGQTLACGSAATAAFAAGRLFHNLEKKALINQPGGNLHFIWDKPDDLIEMIGPAEITFEGATL